jgi:hypothetical protein
MRSLARYASRLSTFWYTADAINCVAVSKLSSQAGAYFFRCVTQPGSLTSA